jgi:hypothetical protein
MVLAEDWSPLRVAFLSVTLDILCDDQAYPMSKRKCPREISALLGLPFHAAFLFRLTTAATIFDFRVYVRVFSWPSPFWGSLFSIVVTVLRFCGSFRRSTYLSVCVAFQKDSEIKMRRECPCVLPLFVLVRCLSRVHRGEIACERTC